MQNNALRHNTSINHNFTRFIPDKSRLDLMLCSISDHIRLNSDLYKNVRRLCILKDSGLFNAQYYIDTNPNILANGIDPLFHYLKKGWKEHLNPSALFDTDWYLRQNPDVWAAGMNPLLHFIEHGAAEGRAIKPPVSTQRVRSKHR